MMMMCNLDFKIIFSLDQQEPEKKGWLVAR